MENSEVHVRSKTVGFTGMKDELSEEVEQFLNEKVNGGYDLVSVSFSDFEAQELVAFMTVYR
jgi:hypothetical protein